MLLDFSVYEQKLLLELAKVSGIDNFIIENIHNNTLNQEELEDLLCMMTKTNLDMLSNETKLRLLILFSKYCYEFVQDGSFYVNEMLKYFK